MVFSQNDAPSNLHTSIPPGLQGDRVDNTEPKQMVPQQQPRPQYNILYNLIGLFMQSSIAKIKLGKR